jgi:hypothetical protein
VLVIGCGIGLALFGVYAVDEGEVATLTTVAADGHARETQVWVVEGDSIPGGEGDAVFLRATRPRAAWLARLRRAPAVELLRDGSPPRRYLAEVRDEAEVRGVVNRAMAEKYGLANTILSHLTDLDASVPVRLAPAPAAEGAEARRAPPDAARH